MASHTAHLILCMAALDATGVGRLIQMTSETDAIRFGGLEFRWIADIRGGHGFRMLASGSVTGFARPGFKSTLLIFLHHLVRAFLQRVEDVFVTRLARLRASVSRWLLSAAQG